MLETSRRILPAVLLAAVFATMVSVAAVERTWFKQSITLKDKSENTLGRMTLISTMDEVEPRLIRYLYADTEGRRTVIRYEVNSTTKDVAVSYEYLETGEVLEFSLAPGGQDPDVLSIEIGGELISVDDPDRTSSTFRQQAAELPISSQFEDALEDMTTVGVNHGLLLAGPARTLQEVFFHDILIPPQPEEGEMESGHVLDFDPATTPPSQFESLFGSAYYN